MLNVNILCFRETVSRWPKKMKLPEYVYVDIKRRSNKTFSLSLKASGHILIHLESRNMPWNTNYLLSGMDSY